MISATRRKNTAPRHSPRAPADFDSESEDQNGVHFRNSSALVKNKVPPTSKTPPRPKSRAKDLGNLWGLDAPSGTDSGIYSSDQTVTWSKIQPSSKTKSTILLEDSLITQKPVSFHLNPYFHIFFTLSLLTSLILTGTLYFYVHYNLVYLRNNISYLSNSLQHLEDFTFISESTANSTGISSRFEQDISSLQNTTSYIQNNHQQLFYDVKDNEKNTIFLSDQIKSANETFQTILYSLISQIKKLENNIEDHENKFITFEQLLQHYNSSLFEIDAKLHYFSMQISELNSTKSFPQHDLIDNHLIESAFAKHYQDQIGLYDFALGSAGGRIVSKLTSDIYTGSESLTIFGYTLFSLSNSPDIVLEPTVLPGNCWPFAGSKGVLGIRITHEIMLLNVTIDHVPIAISNDIYRSSAPKGFLIRGFKEMKKEGFILGSFSFEMDTPFPFQTFEIPNAAQNSLFSLFQFDFLSNHGNFNLTCIYRVRLHGKIGSHLDF